MTDRKLSSGSSEHSSSKTPTTADTKSAKSSELADMQKKMKILKDALVKERQEKDTAVKVKKDNEKELERLQAQAQEKETQMNKYKEEISDLQTKLINEKKAPQPQTLKPPTANQSEKETNLTGVLTNSISGITGIFAKKGQDKIAEEYQKVTSEYNYSKKQLEVMKEKVIKMEGSIEQTKKDMRKQDEDDQKKLRDTEKALETQIQAYRELNIKYEQTNSSIGVLRRDKERLENDINRIRTENTSLVNEREELEKDQHEKTKMIGELNESCQEMEVDLGKYVENVGKLNSQLEEIQMRLQVFDVKKTGKVMDMPAQIIMRRNYKQEYLIEIEGSGERIKLFPQVIQSFGPVPDTEDRFYLDYKVQAYIGKNVREEVQRDVFQTDDRKKMLKNLKIFVKLAEKSEANAKNSETAAIMEKNLLTQMVSFFNN